jgi:hypothetical protein
MSPRIADRRGHPVPFSLFQGIWKENCSRGIQVMPGHFAAPVVSK